MKSRIFTFLLIVIILTLNSQFLTAQVSKDWTHRYTGPEASADDPTDFVVDNSGNIYMTGQSIVGGDYFKFITVKFNSAGIRQWVAKYSGLPFSNSIGISIQIDNSGNSYVTGNTRVGSGQIDLLIIKYDPNGVQQWARQYNGPGNFDDFGTSIDVDSFGNIYAGGYSYGSGSFYDYVLIKYNSSGDHQWTQRWNGASNLEDYLKKIRVTSEGDIVVTGYSYKTGSSNDYATLKYNSSGNLIWTKHYNSIFNGDDQATNLKVDVAGNVYVCGQSRGIGIGNDFATVKYNSAGVEKWVQRYSGAAANDDAAKSVDVDLTGNVFVTGHTYQTATLFDFATIKYDSSGVQKWIKTYNGENHSDRGIDVKTDAAGNVYVTGNSVRIATGSSDIVLIKYDNLGNELWNRSYDGPGNQDDNPVRLIINSSQKPMLIGNSYSFFFSALCGSSDYLALAYSSAGALETETRYDGSGQGFDESNAVYSDKNGYSYVTGPSFDKVSNYDYATLKYSPSGEPLWAVRFDGGINNVDKSVSVAADDAGNVYVTGTCLRASGNNDIVTVKYDAAGQYQWERVYNGPANGEDHAAELKADAAGNTFVTGYSDGSGTGKDFVTIKYSSSGVLQWASRFNAPGNADDYSNALCIDESGNSFVTGNITAAGSAKDFCTVKYNSAGIQQWATPFNGSANDTDEAACIALDFEGNVIVAGKSKSALTGFDFITLKYSAAGVMQWQKTISGNSPGSNDEVTSAACDGKGNILVSGNADNSATGYDFVTVKYSSAGNEIWNRSYNGASGQDDKAGSMGLDLTGNIYVAGFTKDIATGLSFCTIKYNTNGNLIWEDKYNYIDNDSDKANSVSVDASGNVYVTGFSTSIESKRDFFTIKYRQEYVLSAGLLIEGFYDQTLNEMLQDTVKILLRSSDAPHSIIDSSVSVINHSGHGNFVFSNVQSDVNYFIVIDHRNSIETWSAAPHPFKSSVLDYDFTVSASRAFGNNMILKGSEYCVFSGDVNKDDIIDLTDLVGIFNRSSVFASGYEAADVNGDLIVDLTDLVVTYNNAKKFISLISP